MVIPNHKNETLSTLFAIKTLFSQNSISTDAVDNTSAASFFVLNIIYIGKSTFIHKYYSDYLSIFDTFACKYNDAQHVTCCAFVVIKFVT